MSRMATNLAGPACATAVLERLYVCKETGCAGCFGSALPPSPALMLRDGDGAQAHSGCMHDIAANLQLCQQANPTLPKGHLQSTEAVCVCVCVGGGGGFPHLQFTYDST
jgi:hypothetical protein